MNLTAYHAKYYAHELTKRCASDSDEKLAGAVASAQVDLNPHQVDAALFAFSSPLAKGALLADEVGLGKTIEAGLVISQKWAERKRRILVITPSNLRKQWYQELIEKFFLPCRILEAKSYNAAIKTGNFKPLVCSEIVICSYHFARNKAADVANAEWDLVVIDEAHRLRNVYKPNNVVANTLKMALARAPKLLLTATPLQNSLLELFGLVSFIDDHTFGDLKSFREQFANLSQEQVFETLKARLKPICHRTLRRQVTAYIPFTKRLPLVQDFTPNESEDRLYNLVSDYLQRPNLQALPASQRSLMTLVLRKLLASSTFAIAGALTSISNRLKGRLKKQEPATLPDETRLEDALEEDYETLDETAEEWPEETHEEPLSEGARSALEQEIADLAERLGALQKAIIFTESGDIVLDSFAGSGTTGAVGHKMGRRWIMVELGEHCHTHIIPRLEKVIDGEDHGGITEAAGWKGGGGFRYFRLAPSLLQEDKWGNWVISKEYNSAMLAEAICKLEGFVYAPSDSLYWQHGKSTERDFIYVTTAHLNHDQLQQLNDEVGAERSLLVLCTAFSAKPDRFPNLTVRKIPKQVLSRCEWGHDDYSLQVENLPKAPPKKGQQGLFDPEAE